MLAILIKVVLKVIRQSSRVVITYACNVLSVFVVSVVRMIRWTFFNALAASVVLPGTVFEFDDSDFIPAVDEVDPFNNVSALFVVFPDPPLTPSGSEKGGVPITSRLSDEMIEGEISAIVQNLQLMDFNMIRVGCEKVMAGFRNDVVHPIERLMGVARPFYATRLKTALEYCTYITDNLPKTEDRPVTALQSYGSLRIRQLMQYLSDTRK